MDTDPSKENFLKIFSRVEAHSKVYTQMEIQPICGDVEMEDYKSDEDSHSENFQLNDLKGETDKLSNSEISALVISELWNHPDHDQSSFKISGLFENLHINDEVEEKKAYKHNDDSPSFIDSRERSLQFRRKSGADLDNQLEISDLLEYFINRKPRHRILPIMKLKLVLEMKRQKASLQETWQKYFLKISTLKSIVKEVSAYKNFTNQLLGYIRSHPWRRLDIQKWMKEGLVKYGGGVTSKKIQSHVYEKFKVKPSLFSIRQYFKKQLVLSYKKGCPRPSYVDISKTSMLRILYSVRFARAKKDDFLFINIDESSFSNDVWNERSWLKRGINCEIINKRFKVSVSLVLAITSDGDYYGALLKSRLNSDSFTCFLSNIDEWIKEHQMAEDQNIILILDNCSIHRSKTTLNEMKQSRKKIWFIPPYSPSLAPVELAFARLKRFLKDQDGIKSIAWNSKDGYALLKEGLISIKSAEIVGFWKHTISVMNNYIMNFKERLIER